MASPQNFENDASNAGPIDCQESKLGPGKNDNPVRRNGNGFRKAKPMHWWSRGGNASTVSGSSRIHPVVVDRAGFVGSL